LALKDIRTEVGSPLKKTAPRGGEKKRRKRPPPAAKGPELERVKREIMEHHPAMGEELAAAIARCRASWRKARQR
jgi:hypothetical protein